MKIVFWSNYPKSDVTSNMTAVAIMFSILFPARVMMMTNHCNHETLGRTLLGSCYDDVLREEAGYGSAARRRPVIKRIDDIPNRYGLPKDAETLAEDGLYYFTQGKLFNNEVYELRILEELSIFLELLDKSDDYVFIDAKSQDSISTIRLLEDADIVVVNLRQDERLMRDFFMKYTTIVGKSFFFISEYRKRNGYLLSDFIKDFSVHPNRVAVIPYNPEFSPVVDDGRITEYVLKNQNCTKSSKEYYYIWHLRKAAELLKAIMDHHPYLELAMDVENCYA